MTREKCDLAVSRTAPIQHSMSSTCCEAPSLTQKPSQSKARQAIWW